MVAALILLLSASATLHAGPGDVPGPPTEDELSTSRFEWAAQKYCSRRTVLIDEKTSVIKDVSTETREYDSRGRLSRKRAQTSDGSNLESRFSYDQPATVREDRNTGEKTVYRLDGSGRLASLHRERGDETVQVQRIGYTSDDGMSRERCAVVRREDGRPAAVVCRRKDMVSRFRTMAYDSRGNLVEELEEGFPISPVVSRTSYDYSCWPAAAPAPKDVEFVF